MLVYRKSTVVLNWLDSGVHRTLNLSDALLIAEGCCRDEHSKPSTSRSSSEIGCATWKSFPSHNKSNGENLLIRIADTPWA